MSILRNDLSNKVLAIIAIILLTLSDFLFVGKSLVSYALDIAGTNNENVEFMAYFLGENGERLDKIDQNIDKQTTLKIDVAVKQEGYFNGKIIISDSNFKFKHLEENEYISQITEDTVELKQINAGSTLNLELGIEPKISDKINANTLSTETRVILQGEYINSKNVSKNADTTIEGTDTVQINWKSSDEIAQELDAKILTNKIYKEDEENKRIVQVLINSNIKDNSYPVKMNYIVMKAPENIKDVKVHTRSTDATNSSITFNESNYQYDEQNKMLKIKLENKDTQNICWNKNVKDTFVVTYIFDKEENLQNKEIKIGNLINTYDDKELTIKQNIVIEGEVDGITSSEIYDTEDIYKGKIYSGEEREYKVTTKINVDYLNVLDKLEIKQDESTFIKGEENLASNIVYKSTKINKDEFIKIFGEDGFITIKDNNGTIIANINKDSNTDESGKIIVNYAQNTKSFNIVTSKPIALGNITIENTKAILASEISRDKLENVTAIKEKVLLNKQEQNKQIALKETRSIAEIKVNPSIITASEEEQELEIEATLTANDETKDLYKNPKVTFVFPKEIEVQSAKYATLYRNGLEVEIGKTGKNENGQDYIEIAFTGEQLKYDYLGGTAIRIKAQVRTNKDVENKTVALQMMYTNENKNQTNQVQAEIAIESQARATDENAVQVNNEEIPEMLTSSQMLRTPILATNASISPNEPEEKINVSISAISGNKVLEENEEVYEGQTIKYKITVTNNTGKDYENVEIKAEQKNGYVWDYYEEEVVNYNYSSEKKIEHFYKYQTDNSISLVKLENLKQGESYTYTYETSTYLLNYNNIDGNQTYGEISIISEDNSLKETRQTIKNHIKNAELKVDVFEGSAKEVNWYSEKPIKALINIENLTNQDKENVKLKIVFLKNINYGNDDSIDKIFFLSEFSDLITIDGVTKNENNQSMITVNISKIEANQTMVIAISPNADKIENATDYVKMYVQAETTTGGIYKSNSMTRKILNSEHKFELNQKVQFENGAEINTNDKIKNGEILQIVGTVKNQEDKVLPINICYALDSAIEIQEAKLIINNNETDIKEEFIANSFTRNGMSIEENDTIKIVIVGKVNTKKASESNITCSLDAITTLLQNKNSKITVLIDKEEPTTIETLQDTPKTVIDEQNDDNNGIKIIKTEDKIKYDDDDKEEDNNNSGQNEKEDEKKGEQNKENGDNSKDNDKSQSNDKKFITDVETYKVRGTVWIDQNKDGRKDYNEQTVTGITVEAMDSFSGNIVSTAKTEAGGEYILNVPQGNYIIIFNYNDELYKVTTYQAEGVINSENSNAITKTFIINNESKTVAATDSIKVSSNLSDINLGLVNKNKFKLKIEKYIDKVSISNSQGSKTYEQKENTALAKVEIKAKYLKDSLIVVEYKIKVTNTGDVDGYAKEIVDYLPSGLNFNSTMNSDWYKSGEYLYNSSLANTKIKPGETKELILVVTKNMTENNTGLINNKAEIKEAYNSLGIENESKDKGSADLIISVSTGVLIEYLFCTVSLFAILVVIAYLINKRKLLIEKR